MARLVSVDRQGRCDALSHARQARFASAQFLHGGHAGGDRPVSGCLFTTTTVVVAQAVMIVASIVAMKVAAGRGYWLVLLISFVALPIRGMLAGTFIEHWGVWPVQALDGTGAGLQSVAVPGLVACLLNGTGRVSVGQGADMTVQMWAPVCRPRSGAGWRRSSAITSLYVLGSFAIISVVLWLGFAGTLRPACGAPSESSKAAVQ